MLIDELRNDLDNIMSGIPAQREAVGTTVGVERASCIIDTIRRCLGDDRIELWEYVLKNFKTLTPSGFVFSGRKISKSRYRELGGLVGVEEYVEEVLSALLGRTGLNPTTTEYAIVIQWAIDSLVKSEEQDLALAFILQSWQVPYRQIPASLYQFPISEVELSNLRVDLPAQLKEVVILAEHIISARSFDQASIKALWNLMNQQPTEIQRFFAFAAIVSTSHQREMAQQDEVMIDMLMGSLVGDEWSDSVSSLGAKMVFGQRTVEQSELPLIKAAGEAAKMIKEESLRDINADKAGTSVDIDVDDQVEILSGPFAGLTGQVTARKHGDKFDYVFVSIALDGKVVPLAFDRSNFKKSRRS